MLSRFRRDRTRSFEWIGPGDGIRTLVHQSRLGDWAEDFWESAGALARLDGRISSSDGPQKFPMQKTKTLKRKTNNSASVSLAHTVARPGYYAKPQEFVVAVEHVPAHMPEATVATAYSQAVVDMSFTGPYTLDRVRPFRRGFYSYDCYTLKRRIQIAQSWFLSIKNFLLDSACSRKFP